MKGRVIPMWRFLDMQIGINPGIKPLVIDWAKEEPKIGQVIQHIYVYC